MPYSKEFFDEMEEKNLASARVVVPMVASLVGPGSVVDVGCGRGLWLKAFLEQGIKEILGIDGSWVEKDSLAIPAEKFIVRNLEERLAFPKRYDLAVCLEVAEHLPASSADILVNNLTDAAPVILFSAAIPLQGGSHHINEQWPSYWEEKFARRGYVPVDCVRRHIWSDSRVSFFYAQNILIYAKKDSLSRYPLLQAEVKSGHGAALHLVHPFMYTYYAERWRMVVPFLGKFPPSFLHAGKRILKRLRG